MIASTACLIDFAFIAHILTTRFCRISIFYRCNFGAKLKSDNFITTAFFILFLCILNFFIPLPLSSRKCVGNWYYFQSSSRVRVQTKIPNKLYSKHILRKKDWEKRRYEKFRGMKECNNIILKCKFFTSNFLIEIKVPILLNSSYVLKRRVYLCENDCCFSFI